jgi:hypothetical protein
VVPSQLTGNPTQPAAPSASEAARQLQSLRDVRRGGTHGGRPSKSNANARKLHKALLNLTDAVLIYLHELDVVMLSQIEGEERGKAIARLVTSLDTANDRARYFALGIDYRRDNKGRATAEAYRRNHA